MQTLPAAAAAAEMAPTTAVDIPVTPATPDIAQHTRDYHNVLIWQSLCTNIYIANSKMQAADMEWWQNIRNVNVQFADDADDEILMLPLPRKKFVVPARPSPGDAHFSGFEIRMPPSAPNPHVDFPPSRSAFRALTSPTLDVLIKAYNVPVADNSTEQAKKAVFADFVGLRVDV